MNKDPENPPAGLFSQRTPHLPQSPAEYSNSSSSSIPHFIPAKSFVASRNHCRIALNRDTRPSPEPPLDTEASKPIRRHTPPSVLVPWSIVLQTLSSSIHHPKLGETFDLD